MRSTRHISTLIRKLEYTTTTEARDRVLQNVLKAMVESTAAASLEKPGGRRRIDMFVGFQVE